MLTKKEKQELAQAMNGLRKDTPWQGLAPLSRLAKAGTDINIDFTTQADFGVPVIVASRRAVPPDVLTKRQAEVCSLIAKGLSNKDIAKQLNISPATVKDHVHATLQRLELKSRNAIAPYLHGDKANS